MNEPSHYAGTIPSPIQIVMQYTPHEAADLMGAINFIASDIFNHLPWRAQSAIKYFFMTSNQFLLNLKIDATYQVMERRHDHVYPDPPFHTLLDVIREIIKSNQPPSCYNVASPFFFLRGSDKDTLHREVQLAITNALEEMQGLQPLWAELDQFWLIPDVITTLSHRDFFAKAMATYIQCEAILRLADDSLTLDSIALLTHLASPNNLSQGYLYRVALDDDAQAQIPLVGTFAISRFPKHEHPDNNPCVLYVPGNPVREFGSLTLLRAILAADLNLKGNKRLSNCIPLAQQRRVEQLSKSTLNTDSILLMPIDYSANFYNEQIQHLINKQRQDIQYAWSSVSASEQQNPYWPDMLVRNAGDILSLLTCVDTLKMHAPKPVTEEITAHNVNEGARPPRVNPYHPTLTTDALSPIKIHVYIHEDLRERMSESDIYKNYFSWIKEEIERLSSRQVYIHLNPSDSSEELINFNYKQENSDSSINAWKALMHVHLASRGIAYTRLHLFLLLTHDWVDGDTLGVADSKGGQFAIASISRYLTAGHEIGHLLGATHDDGGVVYNGWWHDTIMKAPDTFSPLRGSAYRFSNENRTNIRQYLNTFN